MLHASQISNGRIARIGSSEPIALTDEGNGLRGQVQSERPVAASGDISPDDLRIALRNIFSPLEQDVGGEARRNKLSSPCKLAN